jgi:hypothetical protein
MGGIVRWHPAGTSGASRSAGSPLGYTMAWMRSRTSSAASGSSLASSSLQASKVHRETRPVLGWMKKKKNGIYI